MRSGLQDDFEWIAVDCEDVCTFGEDNSEVLRVTVESANHEAVDVYNSDVAAFGAVYYDTFGNFSDADGGLTDAADVSGAVEGDGVGEGVTRVSSGESGDGGELIAESRHCDPFFGRRIALVGAYGIVGGSVGCQWGHLTLNAIAESVGYKSYSSFNAMFVRQTGMSPKAYREIARQREG